MELMTLRTATMLYESNERFRLSRHEKGQPSGNVVSSQFSGRLSEALRLEQDVEKTVWLSQALAIRDSNASSEKDVRWKTKPEELQRSGWRNLRNYQSVEQVYRARYA